MKRKWKKIKDYDFYLVSSDGKIYDRKNKKLLNFYLSERGYYYVTLNKNKKRDRKKVHRLVAEAFIPNPMNLETVDHINNIKTDNRVENLQWLSREDNSRKAFKDNLMKIGCKKSKRKRIVLQIDPITKKVIKEYESLAEAAKEFNLHYTTIGDVCRGKNKTAKGYIFKYKDGKIIKENKNKKIIRINPETNEEKIYENLNDVINNFDINRNYLISRINKNKIAKGYLWKYLI